MVVLTSHVCRTQTHSSTLPLQGTFNLMNMGLLFGLLLVALVDVCCAQPPTANTVDNTPNNTIETFNYQAGNVAGFPDTSQPGGLKDDQIAGIVVGCVLFCALVGVLAMLLWIKRRRLFPRTFGKSAARFTTTVV
eukprot:jgi/Chrzof1/4225/Cz14g03220.t1